MPLRLRHPEMQKWSTVQQRRRFWPRAFLGNALVGIALHFLHILAFDTDQPGRAVTPRRMQIAFVIKIGHARGQPVFPHRPRLAGPPFAGARDREIIAHDGPWSCGWLPLASWWTWPRMQKPSSGSS